MKDFIKKYGIWLILIFATSLLLSYFMFAFKGFIPTGDVSKESWLSFWGGFLAFYGSVFLGFIAVWQNQQANKQTDKANEQADKANEISERLITLEQNKLCPRFYIKWSSTGSSHGITFLLKNYSDYVASEIEIGSLEIYSSTQDSMPTIVPLIGKNFTGCLMGGEETNLDYNSPSAIAAFNACSTFQIEIQYIDLLDTRRVTVATGKQIAQHKYSFTYETKEDIPNE